jgi:hypothetical protein
VIPFILIGTMLVVTLAVALEGAVTSTSAIGSFKPLTKSMLAQGDILFTRLRAPQLATVRTSQSDAVRSAEALYGDRSHSRVVLVSLGGYLEKSQIIHDWVGTKSLIPHATPSYIVRIYEPYPVGMYPSHNHYWNVIVNAKNGGIIGSFSYD